MMRYPRLAHQFVKNIPDQLQPGTLYISMEYGTAAHSCCCGCGEEVVTPFTPTDWSMTFDGETVSLHPSIGSWSLPCRSHYIVDHGRVIEAGSWSGADVAAAWQRDRAAKAHHYGATAASDTSGLEHQPLAEAKPGFWRRVWRWVSS